MFTEDLIVIYGVSDKIIQDTLKKYNLREDRYVFEYPEHFKLYNEQAKVVRTIFLRTNKSEKSVLITNSDVILRELNHFMALSMFKDKASVKKYLKKSNNPYKETMLFDVNNVGVYWVGGKVIEKLTPNEGYGTYSIKHIDDAIEQQQSYEFDIVKAINK
jgi:hypothetical protein